MHLLSKTILFLILFVSLVASISCDSENDPSSPGVSNGDNNALADTTERQPPSIETGTPIRVLSLEESQNKWEEDRASMEGITVDEARLRNSIEDDTRVLQNSLRRHESERFAGLWIQREPEYRIVVALTSGGTESISKYIETEALAQVVEVRSVEYSYEELDTISEEIGTVLNEVGVICNRSVYVQRNEIQLNSTTPNEILTALQDAGIELPDCVKVNETDFLVVP